MVVLRGKAESSAGLLELVENAQPLHECHPQGSHSLEGGKEEGKERGREREGREGGRGKGGREGEPPGMPLAHVHHPQEL